MFKMVFLFLLGLALVSGLSFSAYGKQQNVESKWMPLIGYNYSDSKSVFQVIGYDDSIVYGKLAIVHSVNRKINDKNYRIRVSGIAIDCKTKLFMVAYDAYYPAAALTKEQQPVTMIEYKMTENFRSTTKDTLLYKAFCPVWI